MASTTGPNLGIKHSWALRENNWKDEMDANLKLLDAVVGLSVIDRNLITPPGTPTTGDRYIPAATATGLWLGHEDDIAIWNGAAWVFYTPNEGWLCYIQDEAVLSVFKSATGWSAGVAI